MIPSLRGGRLILLPILAAGASLACQGSETPPPYQGLGGGMDASVVDGSAADAAEGGTGATERLPPLPDESVECGVSPCAVELESGGAAGNHGFCARLDDGSVRCWGTSVVSLSPKDKLAFARPVKRLFEGFCAVDQDDDLSCWGSNELGELGLGTRDGRSHATPERIALPDDVVFAASSGAAGACAKLTSGAMWCWGTNGFWGPGITKPTEVQLPAPAAGMSGNLIVGVDGSVLSWMRATSSFPSFPSGRDSVPGQVLPLSQLASIDHASAVAASEGQSCALARPILYCWDDGAARLPRGVTLPESGEGGEAEVQQIAAGVRDIGELCFSTTLCLRRTDGQIYCKGVGEDVGGKGQLGATSADASGRFFQRVLAPSGPVVRVAVSYCSVCALLKSGAVECWGSNALGELGNGTPDYYPHTVAERVMF